MFQKKSRLLLAALPVMFLSAGLVHAVMQPGGAPVTATPQKAFMRKKLAAVQEIVEGLATDDFKQIEKAADKLHTIRESAQWGVSDDPFYAYYTRDFENRVEELKQAAKSESPEKATFAYMHVTVSCTACHQRVRRVERTAR